MEHIPELRSYHARARQVERHSADRHSAGGTEARGMDQRPGAAGQYQSDAAEQCLARAALHGPQGRFAVPDRWNRLGKYLQPGQKLKLYVDITSQSG